MLSSAAGSSAAIAYPSAGSPFWTNAIDSPQAIDVQPYEADTWDLRLTSPHGPSGDPATIHWTKVPKEWLGELRLAAWRLINEGVPNDFVLAHGLATREKLTHTSNYKTVLFWTNFAKWATKKRIHTLSETTPEDFLEYYNDEFLVKHKAHGRTKDALIAVSRLWSLTDNDATSPPWFGAENLADYLPQRPKYSENLTSVIPPDVISKLLGWSETMIRELGPDILEARAEQNRIYRHSKRDLSRHAPKVNTAIIKAWYQGVVDRRDPIPFVGGGPAIAFIASALGVSAVSMKNFLVRPEVSSYAQANNRPAVIELRRDRTKKSIELIPELLVEEVDKLWGLLGTAAAICIGYCTGMRLGEVLALEVGCCTANSVLPGGFRISGRPSRKTSGALVKVVESNLTWDAIKPAAEAVAVLERMVGSGKLFDSGMHGTTNRRGVASGRPLLGKTISDRLAQFSDYVSQRENRFPMVTALGEDIQFSMFRRTLAYYIARQPNGLIALAIQYNHMRIATSEGYATRKRDGFAQLLEIETARAAADALAQVADVSDASRAGTTTLSVSGPAATRMVSAARNFDREFPGRILTNREAKRFMENSEHRVFPNPGMFLMCNFDESKALCLRGTPSNSPTPKLENCSSQCGNAARTDDLMLDAYEKCKNLENLAASRETAPFIALRLRSSATSLRAMADKHFAKEAEGKASAN